MNEKPKKKTNRFEPINFMFDIGFEKYGITTSERLIYCAMWNVADVKGYCTLSRQRIERMTGASHQTVKNCIKKFIELGFIRIAKESTRQGVARTYQLKHFYYKRGQKTV